LLLFSDALGLCPFGVEAYSVCLDAEWAKP